MKEERPEDPGRKEGHVFFVARLEMMDLYLPTSICQEKSSKKSCRPQSPIQHASLIDCALEVMV